MADDNAQTPPDDGGMDETNAQNMPDGIGDAQNMPDAAAPDPNANTTDASNADESSDDAASAIEDLAAALGDMNDAVTDATAASATAEQSAAPTPQPTAAPQPAAGTAEVPPAGQTIGSAAPLDYPTFNRNPDAFAGDPSGLQMIGDVTLNVKIELGRTLMYVEDVLRLNEQSIVELDKAAGDPVDIYVNDRHVARGEVLVVNDNFCVRVSEIVNPDLVEGAV